MAENENKSNNEIDKTKVYKMKGKKNKKKNKKINKKILKKVLLITALVLLVLAGIGFGILAGIIKQAKLDVADLALKYENSIVLDREGNTIAVLSGDENREFISKDEMPQHLLDAFVSIEDERFYEHMGIDIKRTFGATVKYMLSKFGIGSSNYGGSTITQQVVKNITKEKDRTWQRKVKEMARAYYLDKQLSKDQILELYLNLIYMGGNTNIYGVEVASNYYFSKSARDLSLAECAFLAGINNTPNSYDPFIENNTENLEKIKSRTKIVLDKMKQLGKIQDEEYNKAVEDVNTGLEFKRGRIVETVYSYHTDAAIMQIINQLMEEKDLNYDAAKLYLYSGGFTIYTTQDSNIQDIMQAEFEKDKYIVSGRKKDKEGNLINEHSQAGMTLIDHKTGYVLATCGGLGKKEITLGFNRGTQLVKQTGSSMKPLAVLCPGIDKGIITAATVFDDVPYSIFKNFSNYRGLITVRYAIESSQNIPMVKAMQNIGTEQSIEFLKSVGITGLVDSDNNLGLALGGLTNGTSPLEMAAAYSAIANDGVYITPTFYTKVVDSNGNTVLEPKQESRTVMSAGTAYIVKEILTQPVKSGGYGYCSVSGMSTAAKSGTTNDSYDRWLCGFTPYYTGAVWYGYDKSEEVWGWGSNPAAQIWAGVMKPAHSGLKGKTFAENRPDNVIAVTVCKKSGLLATDICKEDPNESYTEYFIKGTQPTKYCETHVKVDICKESGLLANEFCPEKESKRFIVRPDYETTTAWQRAADKDETLTIKDTCTVHTEAPDTTKPTIKLNGSNSITLNLNEKYKEEGATATDNKDGDLTSKIVITGKVDTKKAGIYILTYKVEDSAKNVATVTRTITVKDNKQNTNTNTSQNTISNETAQNTVTDQNTTVDNTIVQ
ncbi:MAG: transglycosylase domain-containing protein [Clostridia bacterium]|nr:transglycosylase domain-containing protein [Clostridia bacterium]